MATIAEQFQRMQADLTREKAAMNRTWAKREKQIETIVASTAKFTGELQALCVVLLCLSFHNSPFPINERVEARSMSILSASGGGGTE
jgi:hypothetical protein